ncbi:MAG: mechanosensitive ion channel, partial [Gammaproteobacteria bacterium]|nr:mechanosensitive ion channel [Gammaproteobacteria bacterium]
PGGAAELVARLDDVSGRLATINEYLRKPAPDLAGIAVALPDKARETQAVAGRTESVDETRADLVELNATLQKLRNLDRIFVKWRQRLKTEVDVLDPWREQVKSDGELLRRMASSGDVGGADAELVSGALQDRMQALASDLEATRQPLLKRLDVIVAADVRVGELQNLLRDLEGQLDAARLGQQERPLALTAPPLWKWPATWAAPVQLARQNLTNLVSGARDYLETRPAEGAGTVALLALILAAVLQLRRSIRQRGETEVDELLTHRPIAVSLLVWAVVAPVLLLPEMPLGLALLRGLLVVLLLWRLVPILVTPAESRPVQALLVVSLAFLAQIIFFGDDWYGRVVTVVLGCAALLIFRQLARHRPEEGGRALFRRAIRGAALAAPAVLLVGLVAEVVGARSLGQQAIGGIVFLTLALCALLAADITLRSVLDAWVRGPGARWFRGVRKWPGIVQDWGRRLIRLVLLVALVSGLPNILPALEPVWDSVAALMGTPLSVGNVDLSLGDVLWFFVGIAVALAVARFVRFVLDEDVLPRLPLATGAASAASRLVYYALVVAGIMFALAASGVELAKLTIVISALSVGIGFGLQNVVNNFVSGLILAFERPVREGDQVTLGQTTGRVEVIGLRATRLRTAEGAEVIVPNATLISGEVTNWTLTDRSRRIEITIGVDYDSDPVKVQQILLDATRELPGVASTPAPSTVFRGFGPSSLDFSLLFWTREVDERISTESEVRTRVLTALRAAGIDIPFPRMDLRVREGRPPPVPPAPAG